MWSDVVPIRSCETGRLPLSGTRQRLFMDPRAGDEGLVVIGLVSASLALAIVAGRNSSLVDCFFSPVHFSDFNSDCWDRGSKASRIFSIGA